VDEGGRRWTKVDEGGRRWTKVDEGGRAFGELLKFKIHGLQMYNS